LQFYEKRSSLKKDEDKIYQDFEYADSFKPGQMTGEKILQAVKDGNIAEIKS